MFKHSTLFLSLIFLFFLTYLIPFSSTQSANKSHIELLNPIPTQTPPCDRCRRPNGNFNEFANTESITLGSRQITLPCPPGVRAREGSTCNDNMSVSVTTRASDTENDVLTYSYTVTGGRVVGQGANVNWDLSGVQPGTYTITAAVDDGCGFCGTAKTETITVSQCDCAPIPQPCTCANQLAVEEPLLPTPADESITLTAGANQDGVTYSWQVLDNNSNPVPFENQGSVIKIQTTPELEGKTITATVEARSDCGVCAVMSESKTLTVFAPPRGSITGTVTASGGNSGITVELLWNGNPITSVTTGNNGNFNFSRIIIPESAMPYTIKASKNGFETSEIRAIPTRQVTIQLRRR